MFFVYFYIIFSYLKEPLKQHHFKGSFAGIPAFLGYLLGVFFILLIIIIFLEISDFGKLNLKDINTVHSRVEDFGKNKEYREKYDYVTARAVANLATLSEYLIPICKINGKCICMKGSEIKEGSFL